MPSKITLDTDSITIRRLFALNPATQGPVPEAQIPVVGQNGLVRFLSTIEYFSTISSLTATESVLNILNYVQPGLSSISTQTGVLNESITSTFTDYSLSSFSTVIEPSVNQPLTSTVAGLGSIYISSLLTEPASISVYGFTLTDGTNTGTFTLSSPYLQLNGDYLPTSTSLISTVRGLGTAGYVSTQYYSSIGFSTTLSTLSLPLTGLLDIAYGNGKWVAVENDGYWSSNLVDWNLADTNIGTSVTFGNNLWIAGNDATGSTPFTPHFSLNGINWFLFSNITFDYLSGVRSLYTDDGWYVYGQWNTGVGPNTYSILHSFTGNDTPNWFPMAGIGMDYVYDIAYNSNTGQYMAVGVQPFAGSNILISTDGSNWSAAPTNPDAGNVLTSVATNQSNLWIVFDGNVSAYITSNFGTSWTTIPMYNNTQFQFARDAIYALSLGDGNGTSTVMKTTNGTNWTSLPFLSSNIINDANAIVYANNSYVIVGNTPSAALANSTIGVSYVTDSNWVIPFTSTHFVSSIFIEPGPNPTLSSVKGFSLTMLGEVSTFFDLSIADTGIVDIQYGSSLWMAVGAGGAFWSSNLAEWTLAEANIQNSVDYDPVGNRWVGAWSDFPKFSTDGFAWTSYTTPLFTDFIAQNTVLHTNDGWYVAGEWNTIASGSNNSSIMHSVTGADDTNWFAMAGGVGINSVNDIAYQSVTGRYMAVGNNGGGSNVIVSTDGSNWSYAPSTPSVTAILMKVATNQSNTWIVSGQAPGDSLYITNNFGSNWSTIPFFYMPGLNFKEGFFYALSAGDVNQTSTLVRSTDGLNWTAIPFISQSILSPTCIEYAEGKYVAGGGASGANSSIVVSQTTDFWSFPRSVAPFFSTVSTVFTTHPSECGVQVNDSYVGALSTIITQVNLLSTVNGLATAGYVSTIDFVSFTQTLGSYGYLSSIHRASSLLLDVFGSTVIMDAFYTSTHLFTDSTRLFANTTEIHNVADLQSTTTNAPVAFGFLNFTSTTQGLGTVGYVSTATLVSSFSNLVPYGYIASTQLISTVTALDAFSNFNALTPSYLRIPSPYASTNLFHVYMSSLTIRGNQYLSTPIDLTKSRLFSTIQIDLLGFSSLLLPTSKMTIEIPVNTNFFYHNCLEQEVKHKWFLQDPNGIQRGTATNFITKVSSITDSNVKFGSLQWILGYNDLKVPNFQSTYTLMLSTTSALAFSTVMNMHIASTSVNVRLNNINR